MDDKKYEIYREQLCKRYKRENVLELKKLLFSTIWKKSCRFERKISQKFGVYKEYWNVRCERTWNTDDTLPSELFKQLELVKGYSKKEFGVIFGKKPLNQRRKGKKYK